MRPNFLSCVVNRCNTHTHRFLPNVLLLSLLMALTFQNGMTQCDPDADMVITSDVTIEDVTIEMTADRKIIVTDGATLTIRKSTITRKDGCSGYWDGIYLVTNEEGEKAGLILEDDTRIKFSQRGIQATNGWKEITLRSAVMEDNGQMINARDSWPLAPIGGGGGEGGGGFGGGGSGRGNDPISVYDVPCTGFPLPSKVTISDHCVFWVQLNGNPMVDPPKALKQISVLGGELEMAQSFMFNTNEDVFVAAVSASRGKCKIYGSQINGFWLGVYKGSDAYAHCVSEGLVLTGTRIVNTLLADGIISWAVYSETSNAMIKGNILEANVWSVGMSYGSIVENNIYYAESEEVSATSVRIDGPVESFAIRNNLLNVTPIEFFGDNHLSHVTCNRWKDEIYAVVANYDNLFPPSWGTTKFSAGNTWEDTRSEMYYLHPSLELNYFYSNGLDAEEFVWQIGFNEQISNFQNPHCNANWPENVNELDTLEYILSDAMIRPIYMDVIDSIDAIKTSTDTTLAIVQEELAFYRSRLSELIGQGLIFQTTADSQYWVDRANLRMKEIVGLHHLWYAADIVSLQEHLDTLTNDDAEVLSEAVDYLDGFLSGGKTLSTLTEPQVDSLATLAVLSYGDYTNILRNYLYMAYDTFIPWFRESALDSLRSLESFREFPTEHEVENWDQVYMVTPNPFQEFIDIQDRPGLTEREVLSQISVYTLDGRLVYSTQANGDRLRVYLADLEPGTYLAQLLYADSGRKEIHRMVKTGN